MNREQVINAVGNGKIASFLFTKKDGSERLMSARLGVRKGLTGKGLRFDPSAKELLGVFDMNAGEYRFVNLATLKEIHANGCVYS